MPPRKTRNSSQKAAEVEPVPIKRKGKASGKGPIKSAETIEESDNESFQTPPPHSKKEVPSTPKREKRKLSLRSPDSALDMTSAPSPSPTKRMRTLALNSPKKPQTPLKSKDKAVVKSKAKSRAKGNASVKGKAKHVSEDEDEDDEDEEDYEDEDADDSEDEEDSGEDVEVGSDDDETDGDDVGSDDVEDKNDNDEGDDEEDVEEGEVKEHSEDDPFASLGADGKPNAKRNLKDTRNICVKSLPKADEIPASVYDKEWIKRKPDITFLNFKLGELASWRSQNANESVMTLASLAFYRTFTQDKIVINNIVNGLSLKEDQPFYNAATADPRNFVARFIPSNMLTQYELISAKSGEPVVGIAVGSFVRSTLRGDVPDKHRYQSNKDDNDDDDDADRKTKAAFGDLEAYESPKKKPSKGGQTAARRHLGTSYKFDEPVPILDGRGVKLDYTSKGLYKHLDTLPEFKDKLTLKSPCVIGYNTYGYIYNEVWKVKFNVLFVIVLHVAGK